MITWQQVDFNSVVSLLGLPMYLILTLYEKQDHCKSPEAVQCIFPLLMACRPCNPYLSLGFFCDGVATGCITFYLLRGQQRRHLSLYLVHIT